MIVIMLPSNHGMNVGAASCILAGIVENDENISCCSKMHWWQRVMKNRVIEGCQLPALPCPPREVWSEPTRRENSPVQLEG